MEIITISPAARTEALRRLIAQKRVGHLAFELPEGWDELDNMARLRLLQRQAQLQGTELALITRGEETIKAAKKVGIPTFRQRIDLPKTWRMKPLLPVNLSDAKSILPEAPPDRQRVLRDMQARPTLRQARRQRLELGERLRAPVPLGVRLVGYGAMAALLVTVLSAFTFYVLPAATITLSPDRQTLETPIIFTANPNLERPDYFTNSLPARLVETTSVVTGTTATTGSGFEASARATGFVTFSRIGSGGSFIREGTIVSTSNGVRFRTTSGAELAEGIGSTATVGIEAVEPGPAGNVPALTISSVEGGARVYANVVNQGGTVGGGATQVPVVLQADRERLLNEVSAIAADQATGELGARLREGEWVPPESVRIISSNSDFVQAVDEQSEALDLILRSLVQGVAVSEAQTERAVLNALNEALPPRAQLIEESIVYQRVPGADFSPLDNSVTFTLTVVADYVTPINDDEVADAVAGLTPEQAQALLQKDYLLTDTPNIYRDPAWLRRTLPVFGNRIQVRLDLAAYEAEYEESFVEAAPTPDGTPGQPTVGNVEGSLDEAGSTTDDATDDAIPNTGG